jgi:hypothetical protein
MATDQEIIRALCCVLDDEKPCVGDDCPFFAAKGEGGCIRAAIEASAARLEAVRKAEQRRASRRGGR